MFVILFICFSSSFYFFFCYADVIGGSGGTFVCVNDLLHINVAHCCILETMKPSVWQAANTPSL